MIPKIIHYCNFGNPRVTDLISLCRLSWKNILYDYEIIEWNEKSFEKFSIPFYEEALRRKKYAFASDYARAVALREFGGIYLDTDVEVRSSLDRFLENEAFSGFEMKGYPFTAVWGSKPHHLLTELVCEHYERATSFSELPNTSIVSKLIVERFGINPDKDIWQMGRAGLAIYPSSTLCVDLEESVAVHHFAGSWVEQSKKRLPYKNIVAIAYHANKIADLKGFNHGLTFDAIKSSIGVPRYILYLIVRMIKGLFKKNN